MLLLLIQRRLNPAVEGRSHDNFDRSSWEGQLSWVAQLHEGACQQYGCIGWEIHQAATIVMGCHAEPGNKIQPLEKAGATMMVTKKIGDNMHCPKTGNESS